MVALEKPIAECGVHANVGGNPADDQGSDSPGAQLLIQVGAVKGAVAMLLDQQLIIAGLDALIKLMIQDGELASGELAGEEIVCPRHGARFNIKTGEVTAPPAYEDVATFPVRMHEGKIQIKDDRWD